MDPPQRVNMKIDLVIQPAMFSLFDAIAFDQSIDYKIDTNDLQRSDKILTH